MVKLVILRAKTVAQLFARTVVDCGVLLAISALPSLAQETQTNPVQTPAASIAPLTLEDVLARAKANEPTFANALAADRVAALNRSIARAGLLPNVVYHNQYLYTQPNGEIVQGGTAGAQPAPRFIANNAVHEYMSQGVVTETVGIQQVNAVSQASAAAAVASAEAEISRRGLVVTTVSLFYSSLASDQKVAVGKRALDEAVNFTTLTQRREAAREGAHADLVKAQLQQQQRERDLADARLLAEKLRLDLAVLLFPDPRTPFLLAAPDAAAPLRSREEIEAAATRFNPELQSAMSSLRLSNLEVTAARAAYFPDLALNYTYGIDAPQFAVNGPDGIRNLGYSASVILDVPIWDWLSTQHRVRQSQIRRDAAKVVLSSTQRRLIAQLEEFYAEATNARDQLQSLIDSVQSATESLRLTRLKYTSGEATVFEVVDAQNSLTLAELARVDGTLRYETARANLQLLTGTM